VRAQSSSQTNELVFFSVYSHLLSPEMYFTSAVSSLSEECTELHVIIQKCLGVINRNPGLFGDGHSYTNSANWQPKVRPWLNLLYCLEVTCIVKTKQNSYWVRTSDLAVFCYMSPVYSVENSWGLNSIEVADV